MPPACKEFYFINRRRGQAHALRGQSIIHFKKFFVRNTGVVRDFGVSRKIEKKFSKKLLHLVKVCAIMIPVLRYFSQFSQKEKEKWKRKK